MRENLQETPQSARMFPEKNGRTESRGHRHDPGAFVRYTGSMAKRGPLIFLAVVLAALLPSLIQIAWPFLTSFLLAAILAIVLNPANQWLIRRWHRPGLATFLTTLVAALFLGILCALVGFTLTTELTGNLASLSKRSLEEGGWPAMVTHTTDRVVDAVATRIPIDKGAIRSELLEQMKGAAEYLLGHIGAAFGGATTFLITGLLVTLFLYFLLRHGGGWLRRLQAIVPLDPSISASLFQTIHDSVVANVNGVVAVVLGQGLLLALGFWMVNVRSPLLWGAVAGVASIIPVVGSPMVWAPVVAYFFLVGAYWKALFLSLWGAMAVGSVDNVLRPLVVGRRDKQHPMIIALAAIGGTYAFGPLGILLGPLVVSLVAAVLGEIQKLVAASRKEE
jgi:predicted PurR-regulated permease PerM